VSGPFRDKILSLSHKYALQIKPVSSYPLMQRG